MLEKGINFMMKDLRLGNKIFLLIFYNDLLIF